MECAQSDANEQNGNTLTDGIDFGASYITKEYNWGKLDFEVNASYIYEFKRRRLEGIENGTSVSRSSNRMILSG